MGTQTDDTRPRYITTNQAAARLGVVPATIRTLLGTELHAIRVGRVVRIDERSLDAYEARQTYTRPVS